MWHAGYLNSWGGAGLSGKPDTSSARFQQSIPGNIFSFTSLISLAARLSAVISRSVTGQMVQQREPEFLAPLDNHTVTQGREVVFTCVVNHLNGYKVRIN